MENQLPAEVKDLDDISPKTVFERFRLVITAPHVFFDNMPLDGKLKDAMVFMGAIAILTGSGLTLVKMNPLEGLREAAYVFGFSFISSGFLLILARGLGGTGTFVNTYRAFAYASAPLVILWLPLLQLIGLGYWFYLLKFAIERAHSLTPQRATAALGIYLLCVLGVAAALAIMAAAVFLKQKPGTDVLLTP